MIHELTNALKVIFFWENLSFEDFILEYEKQTNIKISKEEKERWKFSGLSNIDFYQNKQNDK